MPLLFADGHEYGVLAVLTEPKRPITETETDWLGVTAALLAGRIQAGEVAPDILAVPAFRSPPTRGLKQCRYTAAYFARAQFGSCIPIPADEGTETAHDAGR